MGRNRIHQEFMGTLGADPYGSPQIKIWLQTFNTGDFSCNDLPWAGRPPLTLEPQLKAFLQKYLFASAGVITQHFLATVDTVKDILQRGSGMQKFSRRLAPHFLSGTEKLPASKHDRRC
jgi:hypothetical protein